MKKTDLSSPHAHAYNFDVPLSKEQAELDARRYAGLQRLAKRYVLGHVGQDEQDIFLDMLGLTE